MGFGKKIVLTAISLIFILILSFSPVSNSNVAYGDPAGSEPNCRYGITIPIAMPGVDISSLGVGSYLDWHVSPVMTIPSNVEYIRVLRVGELRYRNNNPNSGYCPGPFYEDTLTNVLSWVKANPGSVWLIGNEPDTSRSCQDGVTPEQYAERYYTLAKIIKQEDPNAKIAFGTITQPTPLRLRYLERAWDKLVQIAGNNVDASMLVDIWSVHGFILNEHPDEWGAGIPPGFENDYADAITIADPNDENYIARESHNIERFKAHVTRMRDWMASIGQQNKPLWFTEYGSLFPPLDSKGFLTVTDQETSAYMLQTFNYLETAANNKTGMPSDNYHLVQRWYWFSLGFDRAWYGGSLFDPDTVNYPITYVGEQFRSYITQRQPYAPDIKPLNITLRVTNFVDYNTEANYRITVNLANAGSQHVINDLSVTLYNGDPLQGGQQIGHIDSVSIQGCGERASVSFDWSYLPLKKVNLFIKTSTTSPAIENTKDFMTITGPFPMNIHLPAILKNQ